MHHTLMVKKKLKFYIFYILILPIFICQSSIIVFNSSHYRSGHFAFNSNEDMIIEYSDGNNNNRLFYGLNKNGKYYFKDSEENQVPTREITLSFGSETALRYEAKNIFVNIGNKEYLFSIATDKSVVELYDLNDGKYNNISNHLMLSENFLGFILYSYTFSLLKIDNNNYLISYFSYKENAKKNYILQKFSFSNFGFDNSDFAFITTNEKYEITFTNRIVSCFIMEEEIVVFLVGSENKYLLYIYDFNLAPKNKDNLPEIDSVSNYNENIFSKAYYLENRYSIFIYFTDPNTYKPKLKIGMISEDNIGFTVKINKEINEYNFNYEVRLNDFVKINPKRFIYLSLPQNDFRSLYIVLFDLYNNFESMNMRIYKETFNNAHQLDLELSADIYNDHLILTSTAINSNELYSILMIFGYANYTDSIIDISEYFMDDKENNEKNIFDKLLENIKIENNIFHYYIDTNEIKLVSIPNEILFYNKTQPSENPIKNGDHLSRNYTFKQNVTLEKSYNYYYLDYQPIIKEPTYENYYNGTINHSEVNKNDSYENDYTQKLYYGRTITLQFKLCHKYCERCIKFGYNDSSQFCLSCLSNYSFFKDEEFNSNCVPEGYFYDKEENMLYQCNETNSKFYINLTDSKKICFKSSYECPDEYHYLNSTNNECLNITFPITTIPQIPTTIPTEEMTTIIKIPSTIANIPTTITITEPETTVPKLISTAINEPSTISIIPTTFIINAGTTQQNQILICNYEEILKCEFQNMTNTEIYQVIKKELISTFPANGEPIVINGTDDYVFQVTTNLNELSTLNGTLINGYNLSMIDLAECEDALKEANNIDDDSPLVLLKFEKITDVSIEKNIQYELYALNSTEKLDLSVCKDTPVDIYIPIELSSDTKKKYENLKSQGYDLFDKNSDFYTDICTPYESPNGTDVDLSTRNSEFYNKTETSCQQNCQYGDYKSDTSYLKCICSVVEEDIDTNQPEKFTGITFVSSFYNVLKNSNYKVVTCYKLVFRLINFKKNIGCIVTLVLFLFYLIFLIMYMIRGITPLKLDIAKLYDNSMTKKGGKVKIKSIEDDMNDSEKKNIKEKTKSKSFLVGNKKVSVKGRNMRTSVQSKKKKGVIINSKSKNLKSQPNLNYKDINKLTNPPKRSALNEGNKLCVFKNENSISKNLKESNLNLNNRILIANNLFPGESNSKPKSKSILITKLKKQQKKNKKSEEKYKYSNMELNEMEYLEAKQYDKRACTEVYWSILSREHLILFTFFSWDDYNLKIVKLSRFFFLVCTDMAMNVIFFTDENMHKVYVNYGKWDFIQNLQQSVYSLIISQIIQVFICYLTLTDKPVYQIKKNLFEKKNRNAEIFKILKCIRIKLCIYYVYTFIFFLLYWYLITSFCAVYNNTQKIFMKDSLTSFLGGIIYPFPLYIFPALLRILSLKPKKMNLSCLYKFSDFIPIF